MSIFVFLIVFVSSTGAIQEVWQPTVPFAVIEDCEAMRSAKYLEYAHNRLVSVGVCFEVNLITSPRCIARGRRLCGNSL